jgi:hypothetical protein
MLNLRNRPNARRRIVGDIGRTPAGKLLVMRLDRLRKDKRRGLCQDCSGVLAQKPSSFLEVDFKRLAGRDPNRIGHFLANAGP